jgi:hypothetical protein
MIRRTAPMYLDLGGKEVRVRVEAETIFPSKHTGRNLKSCQISIVAIGKQINETLQNVLEKGKEDGINSTDGSGKITGKWKINNSSYSYSTNDDNAEYRYSAKLEEMEQLEVTSLVVDGLELKPYSYAERSDGDDLIIEAKVRLTESEFSPLKNILKNTGYFSVIRHGLSEDPRQMRFGQTNWSMNENVIKHEVRLVDKSYDDNNKRTRGLYEPEIGNMQAMIAENTERVEELMSILKNKSVLDATDIEDMLAKTKERVWSRKREFYRVKDIDNV